MSSNSNYIGINNVPIVDIFGLDNHGRLYKLDNSGVWQPQPNANHYSNLIHCNCNSGPGNCMLI